MARVGNQAPLYFALMPAGVTDPTKIHTSSQTSSELQRVKRELQTKAGEHRKHEKRVLWGHVTFGNLTWLAMSSYFVAPVAIGVGAFGAAILGVCALGKSVEWRAWRSAPTAASNRKFAATSDDISEVVQACRTDSSTHFEGGVGDYLSSAVSGDYIVLDEDDCQNLEKAKVTAEACRSELDPPTLYGDDTAADSVREFFGISNAPTDKLGRKVRMMDRLRIAATCVFVAAAAAVTAAHGNPTSIVEWLAVSGLGGAGLAKTVGVQHRAQREIESDDERRCDIGELLKATDEQGRRIVARGIYVNVSSSGEVTLYNCGKRFLGEPIKALEAYADGREVSLDSAEASVETQLNRKSIDAEIPGGTSLRRAAGGDNGSMGNA